MFATMCREYGGIDVLRYETLSAPAMRPGCVRVQVEAAGVSFANTVVIAGKHQNTPDLPFVPGTEMAGTVSEVAPGVTDLEVGDRVMASLSSGAFSSELVASPYDLYPIPAHMDAATATALPTLYGTTLGALRWRARLQAGQFLLVHGAGGGTGLAAVDLGAMIGARVIACAGGDEKLAAAGHRGAEFLIDHRKEDFRERVLEITNGRGVDVVYDPVGGDAFRQSLRCTAPEGVILIIGFASGDVPQISVNHLLVKNVSVSGFYWGFHLGIGRINGDTKVRLSTRKLMAELVAGVSAGALQPAIWREVVHERAADALQMVLERQVIGRVALRMTPNLPV
ncbi:MAG: NADPH2:quinone reductase [Gammaproteobacteria bacterium]|jgi:NADPH2:quinone reductase